MFMDFKGSPVSSEKDFLHTNRRLRFCLLRGHVPETING